MGHSQSNTSSSGASIGLCKGSFEIINEEPKQVGCCASKTHILEGFDEIYIYSDMHPGLHASLSHSGSWNNLAGIRFVPPTSPERMITFRPLTIRPDASLSTNADASPIPTTESPSATSVHASCVENSTSISVSTSALPICTVSALVEPKIPSYRNSERFQAHIYYSTPPNTGNLHDTNPWVSEFPSFCSERGSASFAHLHSLSPRAIEQLLLAFSQVSESEAYTPFPVYFASSAPPNPGSFVPLTSRLSSPTHTALSSHSPLHTHPSLPSSTHAAATTTTATSHPRSLAAPVVRGSRARPLAEHAMEKDVYKRVIDVHGIPVTGDSTVGGSTMGRCIGYGECHGKNEEGTYINADVDVHTDIKVNMDTDVDRGNCHAHMYEDKRITNSTTTQTRRIQNHQSFASDIAELPSAATPLKQHSRCPFYLPVHAIWRAPAAAPPPLPLRTHTATAMTTTASTGSAIDTATVSTASTSTVSIGIPLAPVSAQVNDIGMNSAILNVPIDAVHSVPSDVWGASQSLSVGVGGIGKGMFPRKLSEDGMNTFRPSDMSCTVNAANIVNPTSTVSDHHTVNQNSTVNTSIDVTTHMPVLIALCPPSVSLFSVLQQSGLTIDASYLLHSGRENIRCERDTYSSNQRQNKEIGNIKDYNVNFHGNTIAEKLDENSIGNTQGNMRSWSAVRPSSTRASQPSSSSLYSMHLQDKRGIPEAADLQQEEEKDTCATLDAHIEEEAEVKLEVQVAAKDKEGVHLMHYTHNPLQAATPNFYTQSPDSPYMEGRYIEGQWRSACDGKITADVGQDVAKWKRMRPDRGVGEGSSPACDNRAEVELANVHVIVKDAEGELDTEEKVQIEKKIYEEVEDVAVEAIGGSEPEGNKHAALKHQTEVQMDTAVNISQLSSPPLAQSPPPPTPTALSLHPSAARALTLQLLMSVVHAHRHGMAVWPRQLVCGEEVRSVWRELLRGVVEDNSGHGSGSGSDGTHGNVRDGRAQKMVEGSDIISDGNEERVRIGGDKDIDNADSGGINSAGGGILSHDNDYGAQRGENYKGCRHPSVSQIDLHKGTISGVADNYPTHSPARLPISFTPAGILHRKTQVLNMIAFRMVQALCLPFVMTGERVQIRTNGGVDTGMSPISACTRAGPGASVDIYNHSGITHRSPESQYLHISSFPCECDSQQCEEKGVHREGTEGKGENRENPKQKEGNEFEKSHSVPNRPHDRDFPMSLTAAELGLPESLRMCGCGRSVPLLRVAMLAGRVADSVGECGHGSVSCENRANNPREYGKEKIRDKMSMHEKGVVKDREKQKRVKKTWLGCLPRWWQSKHTPKCVNTTHTSMRPASAQASICLHTMHASDNPDTNTNTTNTLTGGSLEEKKYAEQGQNALPALGTKSGENGSVPISAAAAAGTSSASSSSAPSSSSSFSSRLTAHSWPRITRACVRGRCEHAFEDTRALTHNYTTAHPAPSEKPSLCPRDMPAHPHTDLPLPAPLQLLLTMLDGPHWQCTSREDMQSRGGRGVTNGTDRENVAVSASKSMGGVNNTHRKDGEESGIEDSQHMTCVSSVHDDNRCNASMMEGDKTNACVAGKDKEHDSIVVCDSVHYTNAGAAKEGKPSDAARAKRHTCPFISDLWRLGILLHIVIFRTLPRLSSNPKTPATQPAASKPPTKRSRRLGVYASNSSAGSHGESTANFPNNSSHSRNSFVNGSTGKLNTYNSNESTSTFNGNMCNDSVSSLNGVGTISRSCSPPLLLSQLPLSQPSPAPTLLPPRPTVALPTLLRYMQRRTGANHHSDGTGASKGSGSSSKECDTRSGTSGGGSVDVGNGHNRTRGSGLLAARSSGVLRGSYFSVLRGSTQQHGNITDTNGAQCCDQTSTVNNVASQRGSYSSAAVGENGVECDSRLWNTNANGDSNGRGSDSNSGVCDGVGAHGSASYPNSTCKLCESSTHGTNSSSQLRENTSLCAVNGPHVRGSASAFHLRGSTSQCATTAYGSGEGYTSDRDSGCHAIHDIHDMHDVQGSTTGTIDDGYGDGIDDCDCEGVDGMCKGIGDEGDQCDTNGGMSSDDKAHTRHHTNRCIAHMRGYRASDTITTTRVHTSTGNASPVNTPATNATCSSHMARCRHVSRTSGNTITDMTTCNNTHTHSCNRNTHKSTHANTPSFTLLISPLLPTLTLPDAAGESPTDSPCPPCPPFSHSPPSRSPASSCSPTFRQLAPSPQPHSRPPHFPLPCLFSSASASAAPPLLHSQPSPIPPPPPPEDDENTASNGRCDSELLNVGSSVDISHGSAAEDPRMRLYTHIDTSCANDSYTDFYHVAPNLSPPHTPTHAIIHAHAQADLHGHPHAALSLFSEHAHAHIHTHAAFSFPVPPHLLIDTSIDSQSTRSATSHASAQSHVSFAYAATPAITPAANTRGALPSTRDTPRPQVWPSEAMLLARMGTGTSAYYTNIPMRGMGLAVPKLSPMPPTPHSNSPVESDPLATALSRSPSRQPLQARAMRPPCGIPAANSYNLDHFYMQPVHKHCGADINTNVNVHMTGSKTTYTQYPSVEASVGLTMRTGSSTHDSSNRDGGDHCSDRCGNSSSADGLIVGDIDHAEHHYIGYPLHTSSSPHYVSINDKTAPTVATAGDATTVHVATAAAASLISDAASSIAPAWSGPVSDMRPLISAFDSARALASSATGIPPILCPTIVSETPSLPSTVNGVVPLSSATVDVSALTIRPRTPTAAGMDLDLYEMGTVGIRPRMMQVSGGLESHMIQDRSVGFSDKRGDSAGMPFREIGLCGAGSDRLLGTDVVLGESGTAGSCVGDLWRREGTGLWPGCAMRRDMGMHMSSGTLPHQNTYASPQHVCTGTCSQQIYTSASTQACTCPSGCACMSRSTCMCSTHGIDVPNGIGDWVVSDAASVFDTRTPSSLGIIATHTISNNGTYTSVYNGTYPSAYLSSQLHSSGMRAYVHTDTCDDTRATGCAYNYEFNNALNSMYAHDDAHISATTCNTTSMPVTQTTDDTLKNNTADMSAGPRVAWREAICMETLPRGSIATTIDTTTTVTTAAIDSTSTTAAMNNTTTTISSTLPPLAAVAKVIPAAGDVIARGSHKDAGGAPEEATPTLGLLLKADGYREIADPARETSTSQEAEVASVPRQSLQRVGAIILLGPRGSAGSNDIGNVGEARYISGPDCIGSKTINDATVVAAAAAQRLSGTLPENIAQRLSGNVFAYANDGSIGVTDGTSNSNPAHSVDNDNISTFGPMVAATQGTAHGRPRNITETSNISLFPSQNSIDTSSTYTYTASEYSCGGSSEYSALYARRNTSSVDTRRQDEQVADMRYQEAQIVDNVGRQDVQNPETLTLTAETFDKSCSGDVGSGVVTTSPNGLQLRLSSPLLSSAHLSASITRPSSRRSLLRYSTIFTFGQDTAPLREQQRLLDSLVARSILPPPPPGCSGYKLTMSEEEVLDCVVAADADANAHAYRQELAQGEEIEEMADGVGEGGGVQDEGKCLIENTEQQREAGRAREDEITTMMANGVCRFEVPGYTLEIGPGLSAPSVAMPSSILTTRCDVSRNVRAMASMHEPEQHTSRLATASEQDAPRLSSISISLQDMSVLHLIGALIELGSLQRQNQNPSQSHSQCYNHNKVTDTHTNRVGSGSTAASTRTTVGTNTSATPDISADIDTTGHGGVGAGDNGEHMCPYQYFLSEDVWTHPLFTSSFK